MFSVISTRMEQKKGIENRTPVYFCLHMNFTNFYPFLGIFAAFRPSFYYFYIFLGVQKYVLKDMYHTVILSIKKKSEIFILREFCKKKTLSFFGTLALLLFLFTFIKIINISSSSYISSFSCYSLLWLGIGHH